MELIQRSRMGILASGLFLVSCASVPKNAPVAFHEARNAIDQADDLDSEDYMPKTVDLAEERLDTGLDYLDKADEIQEEGGDASAYTAQAVQSAQEAKEAAERANTVTQNLRAWDESPQTYRNQEDLAGFMKEMRVAMSALTMNQQQAAAAAEQQRQQQGSQQQASQLPIRTWERSVAYFRPSETSLDDQERRNVEQIAQMVRSTPGIQVQVTGYADSRGQVTQNEALARERAEAVADALARAGVERERIQVDGTIGQGSSRNPGELQLQRRVDVTLHAQEGQPATGGQESEGDK